MRWRRRASTAPPCSAPPSPPRPPPASALRPPSRWRRASRSSAWPPSPVCARSTRPTPPGRRLPPAPRGPRSGRAAPPTGPGQPVPPHQPEPRWGRRCGRGLRTWRDRRCPAGSPRDGLLAGRAAGDGRHGAGRGGHGRPGAGPELPGGRGGRRRHRTGGGTGLRRPVRGPAAVVAGSPPRPGLHHRRRRAAGRPHRPGRLPGAHRRPVPQPGKPGGPPGRRRLAADDPMMLSWHLRGIRGDRAMPHQARWLEAEFGWHAERVTEAGLALGLADLVPIACRGSSHPALLDHLARLIGARPGQTVLDGGCGLGGPMAWLTREHGCSTVGVDLMPSAARGARRLFPSSTVVVASLTALPFRAGAFQAAWALGSLSTIPDLGEAARELRRVLAPGGCLAIYDFVAAGAIPADAPVANAFTPPGTLAGQLAAAGLTVLASARAPDVGSAPAAWREPILAVEREIAHCHGGDPRYQLEARERAAFGRLQLSGRSTSSNQGTIRPESWRRMYALR